MKVSTILDHGDIGHMALPKFPCGYVKAEVLGEGADA
jgi:hypothetical protein